MQTFTANNLSDLDNIANEILPLIKDKKVVLLNGEMGAGKTTFIKAVCKLLGSNDEINSPTYALVNEYESAESKIYHFDLYRLKDLNEILDIGFEEYIDEDCISFIEWPDLALPLLDDYLKIEIQKIDSNQRKFSIFKE